MKQSRMCIYCHNEKVNLLAYWFGLRHCELCERSFITNNERFEWYEKDNTGRLLSVGPLKQTLTEYKEEKE